MAELESLDLKVKVKSTDALGELDTVANKLDEIHRKAQRIRNNKVGFDADGDAETIGRAQAVESAVDDVDGETATAHLRTEGGRDVRDIFRSVEDHATDLQARTYQLGQQLEFDDTFVTEQLEDFREQYAQTDVEDVSHEDRQRLLDPLNRAEERYKRLETELYVDTSDFRQKLGSLRGELFDTEIFADTDVDIDTDLDTDVDVDATIADIESQLQSTLNERELEVSTDTSVQTQYDLHEQFEETDVESAYADLRGATEGEFDRERTREAAVELEESFTDLDRPDEAGRARTLKEYVGRGEQFISTDQVDEHVRNIRDNIHDSSEDERVTIDVDYERLDAPRSFKDISRTITDEYESEDQPSVSDLTQRIENEYEDTDVDVDPITQRIERTFSGVDDPDVEDVLQTSLDEIEGRETDTSVTRHVRTEYEDTDVPDLTDRLRTNVANEDLDRAVENARELQNTFDALDAPRLEQRADELAQTIDRGDTDLVETKLENVEDRVFERDVRVETDIPTDVDTSALDTDEFQDRVDDLQSDIENRRDLYEGLGVDTDELEQQLTSVDEDLRADIEGGDVDAESLEEYQDQLTEVRQETDRVGRVDTDFETVSNDLDRLNSQLDEFRTNDRDLTQSLEQSSYRDEIGATRDDLRKLKSTLRDRVSADVDLESSDVWREVTAMEGALEALDRTVAEPEVHTERDLRSDVGRHEFERRARSFLSIAENEGGIFSGGTDVGADRTDVDAPRSILNLDDWGGVVDRGSVDDLANTLERGYDAPNEDTDVDALNRPDVGRTRMDRFRSMLEDTVIGQRSIIKIRGEDAFDAEDFLDASFSVDDIGPDSDTDFTAEDVFSYDDRDLTDVFESERSFRAYVNPDMDVELGEALASDVELGDLKRESSGLRQKFERMSNVDMSTFYDAAARLIPMLLTFVGALPAAIAGVLTLAGAALSAAGALAAVGALSIGGLAYTLGDGDIQAGLEEIRSQLTSDLEQAFAPLAMEFTDIGEDALEGVGEFFDVLAAEGYALTEVKDEARAFGSWVFEEVPDAIDDVVALTEVFAPLFGMFGQWLGSTDFAAAFVGITQNILPALLQIVDAFLTMLPTIMQFSQGMLRATGIVFEFWAVIWSAIDALGPFAEWLGLATGILLSLYSALLISSWAGSAFATVIGTNAVGAVWAWITSMATAIQVHWAFSGSLLRGVATALWSTVTGFGASVSAAWGYITSISAATAVTYALAAAIAATGIGLLLVGVGALASQFLGLGGDIDEATKSLENFEDVRSGMDGGAIDNPYEPLGMDAQTAVNPDTSGLQGSSQTAQAPSDGNARDGQTVVDRSTMNVDNSTEMSVENSGGRTRDIGKEIEHTQWRQKSNSSDPYS